MEPSQISSCPPHGVYDYYGLVGVVSGTPVLQGGPPHLGSEAQSVSVALTDPLANPGQIASQQATGARQSMNCSPAQSSGLTRYVIASAVAVLFCLLRNVANGDSEVDSHFKYC